LEEAASQTTDALYSFSANASHPPGKILQANPAFGGFCGDNRARRWLRRFVRERRHYHRRIGF